MSKFLTGLCTLLFIATFTPSAQADPIVVTNGFLTVPGFFRAPNYSFSGENFTVTGSGGDPGATGPTSCFPCVSGSSINVNSFFVGLSLGQGSATFNGTTFNNLFFAGQFQFTGGSVIVPVTMSSVTLTAPFSFSGSINGCTVSQLICTQQNVVFSTQLTGSGLAFIELAFFQTPSLSFFQFQRVTYVFGPTEIPEPMTLLLLAGGLGALGGAKFRRRRLRR